MNHQNALIVFSKSPVRGKVKTRLIPQLGSLQATKIYKELLDKTIKTANNAGFSEVQIWVDGEINNNYFTRVQNRYGLKIYQQTGHDLGQRMLNAFDRVFGVHSCVVLIGSDCPSIQTSDLIKARDYLNGNSDIVLGPANDGGYYLIGLKKNHKKLFENIKWGKASVFNDTVKRINELDWKLDLLPERWDLDRSSDFNSYIKISNRKLL